MLKQSASFATVLLLTLLPSSYGSGQVPSRLVSENAKQARQAAGSRPWTHFVTTSNQNIHTVQSGETLWGIAQKYGISYDRLATLNNRQSDVVIRIGDKLQLPPEVRPSKRSAAKGRPAPPNNEHVVLVGETLYRIAKRYGLALDTLKASNGIEDASTLQAGQILKIPGSRPASKALAAAPGPPPSPPKASESAKPKRPAAAAAAPDKNRVNAPRDRHGKAPQGHGLYQVQAGDSLEKIAEIYGISPAELLRRNGKNSDMRFRPQPGQVLVVPTDGSWYVPEGSSTGTPVTVTPAPAPVPAIPQRSLLPPSRPTTMLIKHMVAPNDSLEALAKKFDTTVDQIRLENPGIRSNRDLRVGSDLKIRVSRSH